MVTEMMLIIILVDLYFIYPVFLTADDDLLAKMNIQ